jgi:hypothetical protein
MLLVCLSIVPSSVSSEVGTGSHNESASEQERVNAWQSYEKLMFNQT